MDGSQSDASEREFSPKKYTIVCSNVPDDLFNVDVAKKHFARYGRVSKIYLRPKKQSCVVEYDTHNGATNAVLNAGAFDGYMFEVTWLKRKRLKSKKDDQPEWKPSSEVQEELFTMGGGSLMKSPQLVVHNNQMSAARKVPHQRVIHGKRTASGTQIRRRTTASAPESRTDLGTSLEARNSRTLLRYRPSASSLKRVNDIMPAYRRHPSMLKPKVADDANSGAKNILQPAKLPEKRKTNNPNASVAATTVSSSQIPSVSTSSIGISASVTDAINELKNLKTRQSRTADDKFRTLDARDRALRVIGGTGSRDPGAGAITGTCPDMCPEKERLRREVENQMVSFECAFGTISPPLAIKQYSRSSADQESPMCYELRSPSVLKQTMIHLLHKVADVCDTDENLDEVRISEWFHFMWDRLRSIRKDITQQALCCEDSVLLIEQCARFHAHCSARLAGYDSSTFDQRLNSDNLTKCLQTLKHMYHDLRVRNAPSETRKNEPEFRGYIALLNLGDGNFMWEVQELESTIQRSPEIKFAIAVFSAVDNNNYIQFFRLVKRATYLQACILLRYFNDVRARALSRMVKAYGLKGSSVFPAQELMENLSFEDLDSMELFINHYGLKMRDKDGETLVTLDKAAFCDSEPYPIGRAPLTIESKLDSTTGEMIAGDVLGSYIAIAPHSSFDSNGYLKEPSLLAEDQGYKLPNNATTYQLQINLASVAARKIPSTEVLFGNISKQSNIFGSALNSSKSNVFKKPNIEDNIFPQSSDSRLNIPSTNTFIFKPAISMASPGLPKIPISSTAHDNLFVFSKPTDTDQPTSVFSHASNVFPTVKTETGNIFAAAKKASSGTFVSKDTGNIFGNTSTTIFNKMDANVEQNLFSKPVQSLVKSFDTSDNIFRTAEQNDHTKATNIFSKSTTNIFAKPVSSLENVFTNNQSSPSSIFGSQPHALATQPILKSTDLSSLPTSDNFYRETLGNVDFKFNDTNVNDESKIKREEEENISEEKRQKTIIQKQEEERKQLEIMKKIEEEKHEIEIKRKEERKRLELERIEEERKRLELERIEEERKANKILKDRKEKEKKLKELLKQIEEDTNAIASQLIDEHIQETVSKALENEMDSMNELLAFVHETCENVISDICIDECLSAIKCEQFRRKKLIKKWGSKWKKAANYLTRRKRALSDIPMWLPVKSLSEEANSLKKAYLPSILSNMHSFHSGHKFTSLPEAQPKITALNIFDLAKQPLLQMTDRFNGESSQHCIFWKVVISLPDSSELTKNWIDLNSIVEDLFGRHDVANNVLHLQEYFWHKKIAICIDKITGSSSISLKPLTQIVDNANALIVYINSNCDLNVLDQRIEELFNMTCGFQVLPVAVIAPGVGEDIILGIKEKLSYYASHKVISSFNIFADSKRSSNVHQDIYKDLSARALRWTASRYPEKPSLQIDSLHEILHQCIGNELWYRFKLEECFSVRAAFSNIIIMKELFNEALNRTKAILLNESIFHNPSFPEEFKKYLTEDCIYPASYEFFPKNWKSPVRFQQINETLNSFHLPNISLAWPPETPTLLQAWIKSFCAKCLWFENHEEVMLKVISLLPCWLNDASTDGSYFADVLFDFGLHGLFALIVKEKIDIESAKAKTKMVVYEKHDLFQHRMACWWYSLPVIAALVPEVGPLDDDAIDEMLESHNRSKRQKLEDDSITESDTTMYAEAIQLAETSIESDKSIDLKCRSMCEELERSLERGMKQASSVEQILMTALND